MSISARLTPSWPRLLLTSVIAALLAGVLLTGCVTNEEQGNPEGWRQIVPTEDPEVSALVPDDIGDKGYLSMGTNPPFAPFEFKNSQGEIIGLEVDLARALAGVLGLELNLVEQDFSMILPAVSAGTLDMGGSGFTDTEERRENYDFVNTLNAGIRWAQRSDRNDTIDPDNACGLTVAVQRNTVSESEDVRPKSEDCVVAGRPAISVLAYDTSDTAATALALGRADAFSADSPILSWAVERSDGRMVEVGNMFQAAPYGIAVPKDSDLGPALAAAMEHLIADGTYEEILAQWNITEGLLEHAQINGQPLSEH